MCRAGQSVLRFLCVQFVPVVAFWVRLLSVAGLRVMPSWEQCGWGRCRMGCWEGQRPVVGLVLTDVGSKPRLSEYGVMVLRAWMARALVVRGVMVQLGLVGLQVGIGKVGGGAVRVKGGAGPAGLPSPRRVLAVGSRGVMLLLDGGAHIACLLLVGFMLPVWWAPSCWSCHAVVRGVRWCACRGMALGRFHTGRVRQGHRGAGRGTAGCLHWANIGLYVPCGREGGRERACGTVSACRAWPTSRWCLLVHRPSRPGLRVAVRPGLSARVASGHLGILVVSAVQVLQASQGSLFGMW